MAEIFKLIADLFLNIDQNLAMVVANFGVWSYALLFAIIFMETGLVVTPFLPGDSLIFAAGALAAGGLFSVLWLFILLTAAAIIGDTVNYWIGHYVGPKVFEGNHRLLKKEYLHKAQAFYAKHGGAAIVLARFVPIVRTFAPFVAGVGKMNYSQFIYYNIMGGAFWVALFLFSGYFFGNLPWVKHNFEYLIIAIILISVVPMFVEWWKAKHEK
ncbi:MAG: DedA family protein [Patescibacteria group bacterium]